jgi:putative spermidine/putrescine transport system substrate-binding protein
MTSAYNGRISGAIKEGRNFKIVWNGQLYALDSWVVVKGSPNLDQAYEFIKFASQPKTQAALSVAMPYGPTHVKAVASVDEKVAPNLPTYPANLKGSVAINTEWWVDHQAELNERFNVWAAK